MAEDTVPAVEILAEPSDGLPPHGATIIHEIAEERLVRHFCLEKEVESLAEWCQKNAPRPSEAKERIAKAKELRTKGNRAYEQKKHDAAAWTYLAALYHLDFSQKDQVAGDLLPTGSLARRREWHTEVASVLSNLTQAFLSKPDAYNAERAADLGIWFAGKLRTASDGQEALRAKLLYRRGIAKESGGKAALHEAYDDVKAACELVKPDAKMAAALNRLKAAAKRE